MAERLHGLVRAVPGVEVLYPRQANSIFLKLSPAVRDAMHARGWHFYDFIGWGGARDHVLLGHHRAGRAGLRSGPGRGVGAGHGWLVASRPGRGEEPVGAVPVGEEAKEDPVTREVCPVFLEGPGHLLVLLPAQRAGRVDEPPPGRT